MDKVLPNLLLVGGIHGIFLAVTLFISRKKPLAANIVLSILFLIISTNLFLGFLFSTKLLLEYPNLIRVVEPLQFLSGPLIYLYIKFRTDTEYRPKIAFYFTFFPFIVSVFYLMQFYILPIEEKLIYQQNFYSGLVSLDYKIIYSLKIVYGLFFIILSIKELSKYSINLKDYFSSLEDKNLNWLKNLLLVSSISWSLVFIRPFFKFGPEATIIIGIIVSFFFYLIGYFHLIKPENTDTKILHDKYKNTGLNIDNIEKYLEKLNEKMNEEKCYLDQELTLYKLAEKIDIKPHHLSQVINQYYNSNFFDFINRFRLESAAEKLSDLNKNNLTILAIAYESGFNSKSAFYNAFKQRYNTTPSDYRRRIQQKLK